MYMPCGASGCCLNAENSSMYSVHHGSGCNRRFLADGWIRSGYGYWIWVPGSHRNRNRTGSGFCRVMLSQRRLNIDSVERPVAHLHDWLWCRRSPCWTTTQVSISVFPPKSRAEQFFLPEHSSISSPRDSSISECHRGAVGLDWLANCIDPPTRMFSPCSFSSLPSSNGPSRKAATSIKTSASNAKSAEERRFLAFAFLAFAFCGCRHRV